MESSAESLVSGRTGVRGAGAPVVHPARPVPTGVRSVIALSVDVELLAARGSDLTGRIHSEFTSAVNVATASGMLWCLTARGVAPGPRAVRIDLESFVSFALAPGMSVSVTETIRIADVMSVRLDRAEPWTPLAIVGPIVRDRIRELEAALVLVGVPGGALAGDDPFSREASQRIDEGLDAIATGIRCGDAHAITRAAERLIGLGIGLTPAGDDVLTGFAYASAQLGGPLCIVPAAIDRAAASGATHAISLTAMREACRGRAVEPLGDLLAALCTSGAPSDARDGASIPELTAALTGIGHTSGTDQAHGLLAAVRLTEEMRGT